MEDENPRHEDEAVDDLRLDGILSTQPELGPSIPDGGYGWLIFLATLFFQVYFISEIDFVKKNTVLGTRPEPNC